MKIGDYVRTNLKDEIVIRKVIDIIHSTSMNDNRMVFDKPTKFTYYVEDNKNYISSSKPIDLIEEGDYVNGLRVEENKYGELYTSYVYYGGDIGKQCEVYTTWLEEYKENEDWIETIITKEQFESIEYKVKDN